MKVIGYGFLLVLLVGLAEGLAFAFLELYLHPTVPQFLLHDGERLDPAAYAAYLERRDPQLGWPPPDRIGTADYDASGARPLPAFPAPGRACVSLYGDSFTYGSEVDDDAVWANKLSQMLDCRVANYGVPGYGVDQMLLRFRRLRDDEAPLTMLAIYPINIFRNVSQYLGFVSGEYEHYDFKPRFRLSNGGGLDLLPLPTFEPAAVERFLEAPETLLPSETFLPDSTAGPVRLRFPFVMTLARVAMNEIIQTRITGKPNWAGFFAPDHPSQALPITIAIAEAFVAEAAARGQTALVIVYPSRGALRYHADTGLWGYDSLIEELSARRIPVLNLGPGMRDYLGARDMCEISTEPERCFGHFNAEGNAVVARLVHHWLVELGVLARRRTNS